MGIEANLWRQTTPGNEGWKQSARPHADNKYLMVSCDAHVNEGASWFEHLTPELKAAMPRVEVDENGQKWDVVPGVRRIKAVNTADEGDEEDQLRYKASRSPEQIVKDMDQDGIDLMISYPNKGMFTFAMGNPNGGNPHLLYPMAKNYNEWLIQEFGGIKDRLVPMALLPTADVDETVKLLEWIGKTGFFHGVMMPCKPVYGPYAAENLSYNSFKFDPVWASIEEQNLGIAYHIGTGYDTRSSTGPGATMTCYAAHSHPSTIEAVSHMCASGLLKRFPKLRFSTIEAGIGYVPWILEALDEAYKKHHLWIKYKLDKLPSEYYFEHGFAAFQEEPAGLYVVDPRIPESKYRALENCFMWANDYPHHEGTWPHSAQAIERQMQHLEEQQRVKILGENAVRCFGLQDLAAKRRTKTAQVARELL